MIPVIEQELPNNGLELTKFAMAGYRGLRSSIQC